VQGIFFWTKLYNEHLLSPLQWIANKSCRVFVCSRPSDNRPFDNDDIIFLARWRRTHLPKFRFQIWTTAGNKMKSFSPSTFDVSACSCHLGQVNHHVRERSVIFFRRRVTGINCHPFSFGTSLTTAPVDEEYYTLNTFFGMTSIASERLSQEAKKNYNVHDIIINNHRHEYIKRFFWKIQVTSMWFTRWPL